MYTHDPSNKSSVFSSWVVGILQVFFSAAHFLHDVFAANERTFQKGWWLLEGIPKWEILFYIHSLRSSQAKEVKETTLIFPDKPFITKIIVWSFLWFVQVHWFDNTTWFQCSSSQVILATWPNKFHCWNTSVCVSVGCSVFGVVASSPSKYSH